MNLTLLICLLFLKYSSTFSLSKSAQINRQEIHGQEENSKENDIYKVQDGSIVKFSYPKASRPILREIIYYHVLEKPYGAGGEGDGGSNEFVDSEERDDDLVETERPFTNGHGFQFLPEPDQNDSSAENEEVTTEIIEIYSAEETTEKEREDEDASEHETAITTQPSRDPVEKHDKHQLTTATMISNTPSEQTYEENTPSTTEDTTKQEIEDGRLGSSSSAIDARSGDIKYEDVEEKRNARAVLFTQARNKYQNRRAHRHKRDVEAADIPEAPRLRPLNLDSLPEYVKKLISTPAPVTTIGKVTLERQPHFNEELQKELEKKIEGIMATLKPTLLENSNSKSDGSNGNEEGHGKKRLARTYGMNLTENRGYVWNDLLGDPGMFIKVGEPIENNAIAEHKEHNEPINTSLVIPSSTHYSAESKPIYIENSNKEEDSDLESNPKGSDDIFVEVKTKKPDDTIKYSTNKGTDYNINEHSEKLSETSTTQDDHTESAIEGHESSTVSSTNDKIDTDNQNASQDSKKHNSDNEITTVKENNGGIVTETTTEGKTKPADEKSGGENNKTNENHKNDNEITTVKNNYKEIVTETTIERKTKPADEKCGIENNKNGNNKNALSITSSNEGDLENNKEKTIDEKTRRAIVDITKSEILQELLKNEQFWKWLGDWTTTYTELLMKHIKNMVHDEVDRQIKTYTANMKKEIQKEMKEALWLNETKPVKEEEHKSISQSHESNNKETSAAEQAEASKASENEKAKDNEDKIIIDNMEFPITHNTNFKESDDLLKRRFDKDDKHPSENKVAEHKDESKNNNSKPPITVTAQNVYGNSAGSDKVTNIFVFYPQNDKIINNIKPFDDGNQENVFLINNSKEDGATDLVAQKDENTRTTDKPSKKVTTKTPVDNKYGNVTEKIKIEDSTQIIPAESSKDTKEQNKKESPDLKENNNTTEANITTEAIKADESTLEANNSKNALVNKEGTDTKLNNITTEAEHNEEITSENSIMTNATEDLEKGVTTEHSVNNKNPASDPEKDSTTTEEAKADNREKSSISPVENATENVIIENTEDPLKTSPKPETEHILTSFTKESDDTDSHTEPTSNKT